MSHTLVLTLCGTPVHVCAISTVMFSINEWEYYIHFMFNIVLLFENKYQWLLCCVTERSPAFMGEAAAVEKNAERK